MKLLTSCYYVSCLSFFFNDTATTEIYTLSLHDALPISSTKVAPVEKEGSPVPEMAVISSKVPSPRFRYRTLRSEEHTSELQSHHDLVCRLLLEKKKKKKK